MRRCWPLLVLLAAGCGSEPQTPAPAPPPQVADAPTRADTTLRPSVALPTLAGDTLALADLRGRHVLVNFWATWCPPCRAETPDLIALHERYADRGLTVVGISVDLEGAGVVQAFADEYQIPYPVLLGGDEAVEAFGGAFALPTSFLLNPDGDVIGRFPGVFPAQEVQDDFDVMLPPV